MSRTVSVGADNFHTIRTRNSFYVDKTDFIRQWRNQGDPVTAIMRPRRFGKSLCLNMMECFFSVRYAGRSDLFEGLSVWNDECFRKLQGTYPVLSLSFAEVKEDTFAEALKNICGLIHELYLDNDFLLETDLLNAKEKAQFTAVGEDMSKRIAAASLCGLTEYLSRYYGKGVIFLLDEFDTPLREACANGYWNSMVSFLRSLFSLTFCDNPYLEQVLMMGILCPSKETVFADLRDIRLVTATSELYADCFGFTQGEVSESLEEFGLSSQFGAVRDWYDGYTFGKIPHIYNPWCVTNFLDDEKPAAYWISTSSNSLIDILIQRSSRKVKMDCEKLLAGGSIEKPVDERIAFERIDRDDDALWSFLLAAGYLKADAAEADSPSKKDQPKYSLTLVNGEIRRMFRSMIKRWFSGEDVSSAFQDFLRAMINGDPDSMNRSLNRVTRLVYSRFGTKGHNPERFCHGLVLGLIVYLDRYFSFQSYQEDEEGVYDAVMEPKDQKQYNAVIIEFRIRNKKNEENLKATVKRALERIEEKKYDQDLRSRGFSGAQIRKYGFAFDGKKVLVGS